MKNFVDLYNAIDSSTKTNDKVAALTQYFLNTPHEDSIWAIALLTGNAPKRPIKTADFKAWATAFMDVPLWLFNESYQVCGDLAETIALLIHSQKRSASSESLNHLMLSFQTLAKLKAEEQQPIIFDYWEKFNHDELFIFNKLITGGFRVGVSQQLVYKALSKAFDIDDKIITHRFMGKWKAHETTLDTLLFSNAEADHLSRPYPFYLAYSLDIPFSEMGQISDWQIERKYDGIRGQIIVRKKQLFVWSRGEELLTDKFPEFNVLIDALPDGTVIDGEILPIFERRMASFNEMQKRISRKVLSKKILETVPLQMIAYDLLELNGEDLRTKPLLERRALLENLITNLNHDNLPLQISPLVACGDFEKLNDLREEAKIFGCEGLMIKHKDSVYETGRRRGKWWKWKVDPYSIDAVLIYAQRGHGRRANLYTDFTFAVWDNGTLVPFTKAYSGLTDKELVEVDAWIKKNTIDKFGPVRSVIGELVFEIAFEGINASSRHKSGIALRFPRIARWRKDKPKHEANTKQDLLNLLNATQ
jgi:DNA ligase 1